MKNPLKGRTTRRATGAMAALASIALVAACGSSLSPSSSATTSTTGSTTTTSSSTSSTTTAGTSTDSTSTEVSSSETEASATAWTSISSAVAEASTGASTADILAANADTSEAVSAATEEDTAGTYDASSATTITASGSSVEVSGAYADAVSVDGTTVTITGAGTFVLTGTLDDGQIIVNAPDAEVRLVADDVSITNADGPAIDIQDAGTAVFVLAEGSTNTLTDGATYADTSEEAATATLFSSDTLTIAGTGSLDVTGSANDAISSKNGLAIVGDPTITVNAVDDGIRGKDYLLVDGGTLTVTAGGDGLKASEDTDETQGFVALGEASVTITAGDDGVAAVTDVTVDGTTLTVTAGGGQANAVVTEEAAPGQQSTTEDTSDTTASPKGINAGVSYTQNSGTVVLDTADEGLQAPFVNVGGGALSVTSGDDGINASNGDFTIEGYENADSESDDGSVLTISGGAVQVDYAASDGIDSNGSAFVTGGQVVVGGSAGSMDGAIDANGETTLVGVTGDPSVSAGDTITVTSADGDSWELTSIISADYMTVLGLTEGTEYTVETTSGGSATGTASALSTGRMGGAMGGGQPPQG
ncbi:MAG: carbohydrate-binding domain-containing protein [Actinomyces sp.]|uniref:carbohydrate-binding domain-containing protein n=1 Tax=Actinomyces sp. TaxID=29317 RepID=UPI0026DB6EE5|nr:carbohydrate-binding domain-containing protein [Actinomyces sp.]MDO4243634.1 carbohydrate-binding domain-containing protein [Actinomyces sp.]